MRINRSGSVIAGVTHEGGIARRQSAERELRRAVLCCLLWERSFYEDGESIAERIKALVPQVEAETVARLAIEARSVYHLRHVPLLLVREMARASVAHKALVAETLAAVIQRADELSEFVAIWFLDGRHATLTRQAKKGLASAFAKFSAYDLAKYNQDRAVKLRDVLFLCHAKPKDAEQDALWKQLIAGTMPTPDTWEVAISAAKGDSDATRREWTRLLAERKLGALALLRNLRNMISAGIPTDVLGRAVYESPMARVLPFRFIAAARVAPSLSAELSDRMLALLGDIPKLPGRTIVLVDVSGSMADPVSAQSDLLRIDAACGVAIIAREVCESVRVFSFSQSLVEVANHRGLPLGEAISRSQNHGGTYLGAAVQTLNALPHDRIIVITDEQSRDDVPGPSASSAYMVNVASERPSVAFGPWVSVTGWSEGVMRFIATIETS